jgi:hypothetical protein
LLLQSVIYRQGAAMGLWEGDGDCDVGQDDWGAVKSTHTIFTLGASSCGVVAVLNHTKEMAWLAHQSNPAETMMNEVHEMLGDAEYGTDDGDYIKIILCGCEDGEEASRAVMLKAVEEFFPDETPDEHWGSENLELSYDASAGRWEKTLS